MALKSRTELLAALQEAVRSASQGGNTSAADVRGFLTLLIDELLARTTGGPLLYDELGSHTDGALTQQAATAALATKADLVAGLVPASQLPSYVDDVLAYASNAEFPAIGEAGKVYIATTSGRQYRWTGSDYSLLSDSGLTADLLAALTGATTPSAANPFATLSAAATLVQNSLTPNTSTAAPSVTAVNGALTTLTTAVTTQKNRLDTLVNGAPAALDTLAEISSQLAADEQGAAAMLATQNQHTQQLANLKPIVAGTNITFDTATTPGSTIIRATVPVDVLSAVARRYHFGWLTAPSYAAAMGNLGDTELAVFNRLDYSAVTTATMCYGSVEAAGFPVVVNGTTLSFGCYEGYLRNAVFSGSGSLAATSSGVPNGCVYLFANVRSSLPLSIGVNAKLSLDNYVATAPHTITYAGTLVVHPNCDLTGVTLVKSGNGVLDDRRSILVSPNGTKYRLKVDNTGALSTSAV